MGEDGGRAGCSAVLQAVERATYCRGLVPSHGFVRPASTRRRGRATRIGSIAASIACWPQKGQLEAHSPQRCGELFAIQNEVLLYDVTRAYFEGQAEASPQAKRGHSRDHRPVTKQVCIALVVTFDGFPLGYEVFAGNTNDSRHQTIVATMESTPWRGGARLDLRLRHGERQESRLAARGAGATSSGAHESELKKFGSQALARRARPGEPCRRASRSAPAPSRDRRDRDPVPVGRSADKERAMHDVLRLRIEAALERLACWWPLEEAS